MKITSQKGFSGIDQRAKLQTNVDKATVMENFRITDSGSMTKAPEIYIVNRFLRHIDGLWCGTIDGNEMILVASEGVLYRIPPNVYMSKPEPLGEIGLGECVLFEFNGCVYAKTESTYDVYNGRNVERVEGYIPAVAINCTPEGGGEPFEQLNLLTDKRRQLISADGKATRYKLVENNVTSILKVIVNGVEHTEGFLFDAIDNNVNFVTPLPEGLNNVEIIYEKVGSFQNRNRILKCTKIMLFGGNSNGRAFLWGNPDYPNYRFHSDLADGIPSVDYFPVNAFTVIGNNKINCIVQQYDRQLIFAKDEAYYSYCELHDDGLGNVNASFPVYSLNGSKGCLFETDGCIIENRPVTLCNDGLNMWESTSVTNEKNAICFSSPIQDSMAEILNRNKNGLKLFDFQANRELYFISDNTAYIYNYGNGTWYTYTDFRCEHVTVCDSSLYFSYDNVLYVLNYSNNSSPTKECIWKSSYITNGQNNGRADIVNFDADLYIRGPVTVTFGFEKENGEIRERSFYFYEDEERFCRITFRPSIKRAMPFRLIHSVSGHGKCVLHGVSITTREKERSNRYGIL